LRRIGLGSAGASTFAVLIGHCGGIAKMRGWRRAWCSGDDATSGRTSAHLRLGFADAA
jgi:hypothetical protein